MKYIMLLTVIVTLSSAVYGQVEPHISADTKNFFQDRKVFDTFES